jgi:ferric-dicitrate binding protein FerR (iron transport regulator)
MMEADNIIYLIIKGETFENSDHLRSWIQLSEENLKEYIRLKNTWALLQQGKEMDEHTLEADLRKFKSRIKRPSVKAWPGNYMKYAALIFLAIVSGFCLHVFFAPSGRTGVMNEISVPNGNRSLVMLPDGSKVWLTNGSKLSYPEFLKNKPRIVNLEGEAFFTIVTDRGRPFYVNLGRNRVTVTGTEFSVVSYPGDQNSQIDLVSGEVIVELYDSGEPDIHTKRYVLEPEQSLFVDHHTGEVNISKITDRFYKYWQKGIYEFRNESFESLAKRIERIYGVKIVLQDSLISRRTFTGAFHIDSNIYVIMESFKKASGKPFEYTIDNNRIFLKCIK